MRSKTIVLVALAIGCGLVAAIGISQVMDARNKSIDSSEKEAIFVAMADINPNDELTAQNIKLEEYPKTIIPAGALTKLEDVEGKRCRVKLYAGEPILSSKLLGENETLGAAKEIPPGMRIVHVEVDPVTGMSNLILPGDRVDVLVFKTPGEDMNKTASKIVLQDIKVFAVDTHTETEFTRAKGDTTEPMTAKAIALLVTPQQAVILHAATKIGGSVRLVLRNPDDKEQVVSHGATVGDIFGADQKLSQRREGEPDKGKNDLDEWLDKQKGEAPPTPPAPIAQRPAGPVRRMIVVYGSELQQIDFAADGSPLSNPFQKGGPQLGGAATQLTGEDQPPATEQSDEPDSSDKSEDFISPDGS